MGVIPLWDNVWHRRGGRMAQVNLDNALESGRDAAEAQGGEVLASWYTAQACKFAISEPREVRLKGIAETVQVVSISWR